MSFEKYSSQEFAENELFRRWVLAPTEEISAFWEMFLSLHPEKNQDILKAKALILAINKLPEYSFHEDLKSEMWQNIASRTNSVGDKTRIVNWVLWKVYGGIAAAFILIALTGYWLYSYTTQVQTKKLTYSYLIDKQAETLLESRNTTATNLCVPLPDGSSVILTKGSRMSYAANFKNNRTVFLDGDGFFEVQKNAAKPFVVYAGQLVTKVVGTSFWIRNNTLKDTIEVDVRTGCVAVSLVHSAEEAFSDTKPQFLLVANQRAMYLSVENRLQRSLVVNPVPVKAPQVFAEIVYEDKPVTEILEELEKSYAIDIVFDADELKECRINTSFSDETFFQRLEIICRVMEAQYQIIETQIVIKGKGCK